ncbi:MAG: peptidoglycan DD-metalloendopeptidase family protein [Gemmatimonadota bacterium]|nr:peptidoglycan DD-metalloendopeptidase family protein [Gemmatimonadota bacterium]
MKPRRSVSVLLQADGALKSQRFRLPLWGLRTGLALLVVAAVLLLLGLAFYGPVARQAARVPGLERELERLRQDNARIRELAAALDSLEQQYGQVRQMVGADLIPDPLALRSSIPLAAPIYAHIPGAPVPVPGPTLPGLWPLDERGYLTRGQAGPERIEETHLGVDIAVPVGTLVRASGGGRVVQAGEDDEYGRFVLISHPDGYETMYGHLSRIVVGEGDRVNEGEVIGRSGNTGRSSAPHLHFEIRQNGTAVDPITMLKEIP